MHVSVQRRCVTIDLRVIIEVDNGRRFHPAVHCGKNRIANGPEFIAWGRLRRQEAGIEEQPVACPCVESLYCPVDGSPQLAGPL
jgi:hypothetical protein